MSDLAATNCGGGCGCDNNNNSCFIIILLLLCCGGGCGSSGSGFFGGGDCGCNSIIWIILLLCCCGSSVHYTKRTRKCRVLFKLHILNVTVIYSYADCLTFLKYLYLCYISPLKQQLRCYTHCIKVYRISFHYISGKFACIIQTQHFFSCFIFFKCSCNIIYSHARILY